MFIIVTIFCAVLTAAFFYFETVRVAVLNFNVKKPHGPPAKNVFLGNIANLHTTSDKVFKLIREWVKIYYPIYSLRCLHVNGVMILSPQDCEQILSNPKHNEKSIIYNIFNNWLGSGLLTSKGQKWLKRRKILTPAFHFRILQQFITTFNNETEKLVDSFRQECDKSYVNVNPYVRHFTLTTITETAMGSKLSSSNTKHVSYIQAIFDIGEILIYRLLHAWLVIPLLNYLRVGYFKERQTVKVLHNFTRDVISERERTVKDIVVPSEEKDEKEGAEVKERLAMLDLLLLAKNKEGVIDDEGIREEVDTFMFEGHDTTATALNFALMLIACHKYVQDRIVEEIIEVLGDTHKRPSYNDFQEMKYLERTIKEVLRLYPSVHFISRKLGEDLTTNSGYFLPKGTYAHIHIYGLHHNPTIYPDPEKFDPDRFLPENSKNRHPFAYLPFSAGSRNCIGQRYAMLEMKAAICGILSNFILESVDTPDTIVLTVDLVLRTKAGIKVKFLPRTART